MLADVHLLHVSDFYEIRDFKCNCTECNTSASEFNDTLCFCFVRTGFFEYRTFKRNYDTHAGRVLISKPDYEHRVHHIDNQPDLCSVFNFTKAFYDKVKDEYKKVAGWFLENNDIHSILINTKAGIDYIHHCIAEKIFFQKHDHLLIDDLVLQLVDKTLLTLGNMKEPSPLSESLKKYHLGTVEKAKAFILQNFEKDISLQHLTDHCCVSMFHFSRIFKSIMQVSPYQYLISVRLHHAHMLLGSTSLPIAQIAFQCGFNSPEQFTTAYRQHFKTSPSALRKMVRQ